MFSETLMSLKNDKQSQTKITKRNDWTKKILKSSKINNKWVNKQFLTTEPYYNRREMKVSSNTTCLLKEWL